MFDWKYIDETFLYDGSFCGLLTMVFDSYMNNQIPIKICPEYMYENNLLDKITYIDTDNEKARRIFDGLIKNVSYETLYNAYNAFLNGHKNKEMAVLKYMISAFKVGHEINNMLAVDYVFETMQLKRATWLEAHRLKGLIRLKYVSDNLYYASIHPDNDVVEVVGKHFVKRFPAQNFILHDKNRKTAFIYNTKEASMMDVPDDFEIPEYCAEEKLYQDLWKAFFKAIAIKERTNQRLQKQFMPKRYWKNLVEID